MILKIGNKVIEFNGDKWHTNPKKYKENECPRPLGHPFQAKEIWNNDIKRNSMMLENGYDVLEVWMSDVRKNEKHELQKCLNFLMK